MKRYIRSSIEDDPINYTKAGYPILDEILDKIVYFGGFDDAISGRIDAIYRLFDDISFVEWLGDDTSKAKRFNDQISNLNDSLDKVERDLIALHKEVIAEAKRQNQ